jgi:TPR repeat protein
MKVKSRTASFLLLVLHAGFQLHAQQTNSYRAAFEQILARAEKGDAGAECAMGEFYTYGLLGLTQSDTEAVKWYRKAAEQNEPEAQCNLGLCYESGHGVPKDEAEASKWYRKAADQKNNRAQLKLGILYETGHGVMKDEVEAAKWYRKAAEQNVAQAQYNLGCHYANGDGVAKDEVEGAKWYRAAAERNYRDAQVNIGTCYALGAGVKKDYVEAYKWYSLALAQGEEVVRKNFTILAGLMTTDQIAEAQKLVREFKPLKSADSDWPRLQASP